MTENKEIIGLPGDVDDVERFTGEVVDDFDFDPRIVNATETYGKDVVNKAISELPPDFSETQLYMKIEELLEAKAKADAEVEKEEEEVRTIPKEREAEYQQYLNTFDLDTLYNYKLLDVYKTSAVKFIDLVDVCSSDKRLDVELYGNARLACLMQFKEDVVAEGVQKCLSYWEDNPNVLRYIDNYLLATGTAEDDLDKARNKLITYASESLKNEESPILYKQFRVIKYWLDEGQAPCANDEIFSDEEKGSEYMSRVNYYREQNTPSEPASDVACEEALSKDYGIAGAVGSFTGKVLKFKYGIADDFNDCLRNSMGDYADKYDAYREKAARKKEILQQEKEEEEERERQRKREERQLRREERREDKRYRQSMQMGSGYGNRRYNDPRMSYSSYGYGRSRGYGYNHGMNFAPRLPMWLIAILVNVVAILLIALCISWGRAIFPGIGLGLASFGFIKQKVGEPNSMPMIIGGYAIAVAALIFL